MPHETTPIPAADVSPLDEAAAVLLMCAMQHRMWPDVVDRPPPERSAPMDEFPAQLEDFCTRFAAGAGSQWKWQKEGDTDIRARADDQPYCPLTAQILVETGHHVGPLANLISFTQHGYPPALVNAIMDAADQLGEDSPARAALRHRLLTICHLDPDTTPS